MPTITRQRRNERRGRRVFAEHEGALLLIPFVNDGLPFPCDPHDITRRLDPRTQPEARALRVAARRSVAAIVAAEKVCRSPRQAASAHKAFEAELDRMGAELRRVETCPGGVDDEGDFNRLLAADLRLCATFERVYGLALPFGLRCGRFLDPLLSSCLRRYARARQPVDARAERAITERMQEAQGHEALAALGAANDRVDGADDVRLLSDGAFWLVRALEDLCASPDVLDLAECPCGWFFVRERGQERYCKRHGCAARRERKTAYATERRRGLAETARHRAVRRDMMMRHRSK